MKWRRVLDHCRVSKLGAGSADLIQGFQSFEQARNCTPLDFVSPRHVSQTRCQVHRPIVSTADHSALIIAFREARKVTETATLTTLFPGPPEPSGAVILQHCHASAFSQYISRCPRRMTTMSCRCQDRAMSSTAPQARPRRIGQRASTARGHRHRRPVCPTAPAHPSWGIA